MPHWMMKAVAQKTISLVPGSRIWNHLFQSHITKSLDLDRSEWPCPSRFTYKLVQCQRHLENYMSAGCPAPRTVLELGTGWHPIIPVGLFLCGAGEIWTIDQESLLSLKSVRNVLARFANFAWNSGLAQLLPRADRRRIGALEEALASKASSSAALLARLNIHTLVGDARHTGLPAASCDLIVSNNTLEHIPLPVLTGVFQEFRRLPSPSGVMSHFVDMADHYVHFDDRLSPYNFLRYSESTWRLLNNPLQYLNRLRIADYRALHTATGFTIRQEDSDASAADRLAGIRLAAEFQLYSGADLAVTSSWLVSMPTPAM